MTEAANLTALEVEVLQRLAASRVTLSSVKFAAEMFGAFDGQDLGFGDVTFELIEFILRGLNDQGLVVYRLSPQMQITADGTLWVEEHAKQRHGVPIHIRVTPAGFEAIGYTTTAVTVGVRRGYAGESAVHPGDQTDFRNQGFMAKAFGPIERCPLTEHLERYPDHRTATPGGF